MINNITNVSLIIPALKAEYLKRIHEQVLATLATTKNNKSKAARLLGIERTALTMFLKAHYPHLVKRACRGKKYGAKVEAA